MQVMEKFVDIVQFLILEIGNAYGSFGMCLAMVLSTSYLCSPSACFTFIFFKICNFHVRKLLVLVLSHFGFSFNSKLQGKLLTQNIKSQRNYLKCMLLQFSLSMFPCDFITEVNLIFLVISVLNMNDQFIFFSIKINLLSLKNFLWMHVYIQCNKFSPLTNEHVLPFGIIFFSFLFFNTWNHSE